MKMSFKYETVCGLSVKAFHFVRSETKMKPYVTGKCAFHVFDCSV